MTGSSGVLIVVTLRNFCAASVTRFLVCSLSCDLAQVWCPISNTEPVAQLLFPSFHLNDIVSSSPRGRIVLELAEHPPLSVSALWPRPCQRLRHDDAAIYHGRARTAQDCSEGATAWELAWYDVFWMMGAGLPRSSVLLSVDKEWLLHWNTHRLSGVRSASAHVQAAERVLRVLSQSRADLS